MSLVTGFQLFSDRRRDVCAGISELGAHSFRIGVSSGFLRPMFKQSAWNAVVLGTWLHPDKLPGSNTELR